MTRDDNSKFKKRILNIRRGDNYKYNKRRQKNWQEKIIPNLAKKINPNITREDKSNFKENLNLIW